MNDMQQHQTRKQLVQAMEAFSNDQESHYREEENDIVPKCLAHLSPQQVSSLLVSLSSSLLSLNNQLQLGPLVPQILNDYRLYKSAIQITSIPTVGNFVERKQQHHAPARNQDREEQVALTTLATIILLTNSFRKLF